MVNTAPIDEKGATSTTNSIGMAPNATDKRVQGVARALEKESVYTLMRKDLVSTQNEVKLLQNRLEESEAVEDFLWSRINAVMNSGEEMSSSEVARVFQKCKEAHEREGEYDEER